MNTKDVSDPEENSDLESSTEDDIQEPQHVGGKSVKESEIEDKMLIVEMSHPSIVKTKSGEDGKNNQSGSQKEENGNPNNIFANSRAKEMFTEDYHDVSDPESINKPADIKTEEEPQSSTQHCRVVIIGAGPAGLAAAVRLKSHGVEDVVILEAGERVGGRVYSAPLVGDRPRVEKGAQWIHGEVGNAVHRIAADLGCLDSVWDDAAWISPRIAQWRAYLGRDMYQHILDTGEILDPDKIAKLGAALGEAEESLGRLAEESWAQYTSKRDYIEQTFRALLATPEYEGVDPALVAPYLHWWCQCQANVDGAELGMVGPHHSAVARECPGNNRINLAIPYQQLLETYAAAVLGRVQLGRRVARVRYTEQEVAAVTEDGAETRAEVCILTLPLGVLKQEHAAMFDPELPEDKQAAIESMGFRTAIVKIFILFECSLSQIEGFQPKRFHLLRRDPALRDWTDSVFRLWPDHAEERALVAWVSGPATDEVEALGEAAVLAGVTGLLDTFLRPSCPALPRPGSCHVQAWGSDPLYRGTYSYLGPATPPDTPSVLGRPLAGGRLLVAGEATHEKFFGTVHGAIESGWREADRAARVLGIRDREDLTNPAVCRR